MFIPSINARTGRGGCQWACLLLWRSEFDSHWSHQFFCKIVVEKNENKQKEAGLGLFLYNCPYSLSTVAETRNLFSHHFLHSSSSFFTTQTRRVDKKQKEKEQKISWLKWPNLMWACVFNATPTDRRTERYTQVCSFHKWIATCTLESLWLIWQSGRFRFLWSTVQNQSSAKFYIEQIYC